MLRSICILAFVLLSCSSQAQIELIRQSFDEVSVDSILSQLHRQYGLKYAYQSESIDKVQTSWSYTGSNLNEALVQLFDPLGLEFKIVREDLILIREKDLIESSAPFSYHVKGRVIDGETAEPLPFASIQVPGEKVEYADSNGRFDLKFQHAYSKTELLFTFLSYSMTAREIESHTNHHLEIKLYPFIQELEAVQVVAGSSVFSRDQTRQDVLTIKRDYNISAQGFSDPLASLQSLPGVANYTESGGLLNIRGGDDFDNYILLDGLPLYKVDHFFGYFSVLSPEIVEQVSIYKNAFPSQYGGKSSSVVDIHSKEFTEKWQGIISAGLLYTSAAVKIPVSDKVQAFAGIRFNNLNLANDYFSDITEQQSGPGRLLLRRNPNIRYKSDHNPGFSFYDAYAKVQYQLTPSTEFFMNFFRGEDHFKNELQSVYLWQGSNVRFRLTERYEDNNRWQNTGSSFQVKHNWRPDLKTNFSIAYTGHASQTDVSYTIENIASDNVIDDLFQGTQNELKGLFINLNNSYQIARTHNLKFGLQFSREHTTAHIFTQKQNTLERDMRGDIWSAYYEYEGNINELSLTAGMRHSYYREVDQLYHSPRLFMKYDLTNNYYVKASWSIYQQFVRQFYHESPTGRTHYLWVMANERNIPVLDRQHFMLGTGGYWNKLSIDAELYDIRSIGELEHALALVGFDPMNGRPQWQAAPLLFQGNGRTVGMDLYFRWHGEQFQPFVSYTLSKSTVAYEEINEGADILAQNDRRHQFSTGMNYQLDQWEFQIQYHYASGRPYTNLSRYKNSTRDRRTQLSLREDRLPSYQRCDLSATYTIPLGNQELRLKASVFNLFNRRNVKYYQYMYAIRQPGEAEHLVLGFDQYMLGIQPNLELSWRF